MEKETSKIPASLLTLVGGVAIAAISFWYGQNNHLMPGQASEQAPLVDDFFNVMITIATALFIVVEGAIVYFAIKFRYRPGDETDGSPISENFALEIFWTAIPAILVIGVGIYSVEVYRDMGGFDPGGSQVMAHIHDSSHGSHKMPKGTVMAASLIADSEGMGDEMSSQIGGTPTPKYGFGAKPSETGKFAGLTVNVTGMQYAWIFNYPESGVTSGELHVPTGKSVQLNLSAVDVIHSFWVPEFRLKQDAIPGIPTELRFVATKPGDYPVYCAELCGGYHGAMRTRVIVHTPEEYDSWLKESLIAQELDVDRAIAVNPANLSESEFLAPYVSEMGIKPEIVAQLQPIGN